MSNSIWSDPRITAYVLGDLPEDERASFEQELESNAELSAAVVEARIVTGQLESLYAAEPIASLDAQRRDAIAAGVQEPSDDQELSDTNTIVATEPTSWRIPLTVLAIAASIMILFGIAPWLQNQKRQSTISSLNDAEQSMPGEFANTSGVDRDVKAEMVDVEYLPSGQLLRSDRQSSVSSTSDESGAAAGGIADGSVALGVAESQDMMQSQLSEAVVDEVMVKSAPEPDAPSFGFHEQRAKRIEDKMKPQQPLSSPGSARGMQG